MNSSDEALEHSLNILRKLQEFYLWFGNFSEPNEGRLNEFVYPNKQEPNGRNLGLTFFLHRDEYWTWNQKETAGVTAHAAVACRYVRCQCENDQVNRGRLCKSVYAHRRQIAENSRSHARHCGSIKNRLIGKNLQKEEQKTISNLTDSEKK